MSAAMNGIGHALSRRLASVWRAAVLGMAALVALCLAAAVLMVGATAATALIALSGLRHLLRRGARPSDRATPARTAARHAQPTLRSRDAMDVDFREIRESPRPTP